MFALNCFRIALGTAILATVPLVSAVAQTVSPLPVPDITPPPGMTAIRDVQAGGVQIYVCRGSSAGAYAWILREPKAILVNADGSDFGTHGAGPHWTATDGSTIVADGAHPAARVDRPGTIPALLLNVTASSGNGALTGVRMVRRGDTFGGLAPASGCDAAHADVAAARHYSAMYTFYR